MERLVQNAHVSPGKLAKSHRGYVSIEPSGPDLGVCARWCGVSDRKSAPELHKAHIRRRQRHIVLLKRYDRVFLFLFLLVVALVLVVAVLG